MGQFQLLCYRVYASFQLTPDNIWTFLFMRKFYYKHVWKQQLAACAASTTTTMIIVFTFFEELSDGFSRNALAANMNLATLCGEIALPRFLLLSTGSIIITGLLNALIKSES